MGDEQHPDDARERGRQSAHNHKRIEPRLKIDDDEHIDQHDGERDADEELLIGVSHCLGLPAHDDAGAGWNVLGGLIENSLDIGGNGAEVPLLVGGINVDHRLNRVMRDDGRAHFALQRR